MVSEKLFCKYPRNWTKQNATFLFFRHVHEVRRRDEGGAPRRRPHTMARVGPRPRRHVGRRPRASTDVAPSPIYSSRRENPKTPSHISRKHPLPPPPSTLTRGVSEALPGTLPERGIITGAENSYRALHRAPRRHRTTPERSQSRAGASSRATVNHHRTPRRHRRR